MVMNISTLVNRTWRPEPKSVAAIFGAPLTDGWIGDNYFTVAQTYVDPPGCKSLMIQHLQKGGRTKTSPIGRGD